MSAAHEAGWLNLGVKKCCHTPREFRNLIHPSHQVAFKSVPEKGTVRLPGQ